MSESLEGPQIDVVVFKKDGTMPTDEELGTVLDNLARYAGFSKGAFEDCIDQVCGQEYDESQNIRDASWHNEEDQYDNESGAGRTLSYVNRFGDEVHIWSEVLGEEASIPVSEFREAFKKVGIVVSTPNLDEALG